MTHTTHAHLWHRLPSIYPEISVWCSIMGPLQFVATYNATIKSAIASVKRTGVTEPMTILGTFTSTMRAFDACEKYYRSNLS